MNTQRQKYNLSSTGKMQYVYSLPVTGICLIYWLYSTKCSRWSNIHFMAHISG